MMKIDFSKFDNPVLKHIIKSFHAREDFELNMDTGISLFFTSDSNHPIKLFKPIWERDIVHVTVFIYYRDVFENPEIPIKIQYWMEGVEKWENAYEGTVDSIRYFDDLMVNIGLFNNNDEN